MAHAITHSHAVPFRVENWSATTSQRPPCFTSVNMSRPLIAISCPAIVNRIIKKYVTTAQVPRQKNLHPVIRFVPLMDVCRFYKSPPPGYIRLPAFKPSGRCRGDGDRIRVDVNRPNACSSQLCVQHRFMSRTVAITRFIRAVSSMRSHDQNS